MQADWSLDDVAAALAVFDPSCEREEWIKIGTALKAEYGDAAFPVWDDWSAQGGNYQAHAARDAWKSLRAGRVSFGWFVKVAKARGYQPQRRELTPDEKRRLRAEREARRKELERQVLADEAKAAAWHERVAEVCRELFQDHMADSGKSDYLQRKKVGAYGLRFVSHGVVVLTHVADERIELISGREAINAFFEHRKAGDIDPEATSFRYLKYGTAVVPMRDEFGRLWGLQFINGQGGKQFLKFARKQGLCHVLDGGASVRDVPVIGVAEGYATAASVHQATGWPVAVAFDCGNLLPVCRQMRELAPEARLVVCGDDDHASKGNPGRTKGEAAAKAVGGVCLLPQFDAAVRA